MLDWLRRELREPHVVRVGGKELPIVIRRMARARRMTLRLSPDGGAVHISIPERGTTPEALAFVDSRRSWLARQLAAVPPAEPVAPGGTIRFRGEPLVIDHRPGLPRRPQLVDGSIRLGGAPQSIATRIRYWLEDEARLLFAADLAEYCARAGRAPAPLALSRARRRWGSCSQAGTIRLNWRLVMAPDPVRRSVIAHEVAHLVHFDHSRGFHSLHSELFEGDLRAANAWLKREGRSLYLPFG